MKQFFFYLGLVAGFTLPLFNIPFIIELRKNRSSQNISLVWAIGIWVCATLMLPQVLLSPDWSFKIFGVVQFVLVTLVTSHVLYYRK